MGATRETKKNKVARLIENAILSGQYRIGSRLRELSISAEYGVSQACVREALQELENVGLVIKHANGASSVVSLDETAIAHLYEVRRELEPLAFAHSAASITQEGLDKLQTLLHTMNIVAEQRDYAAYAKTDFEFHAMVWSSQPNRYLEKCLRGICLPLFAHDLVRRYSTAYLEYGRALKHHQVILDALKTRDPELVSRLMRRMVTRFLREDLGEYRRVQEMYEGTHTPQTPGGCGGCGC